MPYKSAKQQAYLHAKHPEIAAKWDREQKKSGKPFPQSNTRAHVEHHSPTKVKEVKMTKGSKGDKVVSGGRGPLPGGKPVGGKDDSEMAAKEAQSKASKGPLKGGGPAKMEAPEDGQDRALAMRGMSSEAGARAWKGTGYSVPKDQSGNHTGGKSVVKKHSSPLD